MISGNKSEYCSDDISKIENYEKALSDNSQVWDIHHRRETIFTRDELIEMGEYWNRPAVELIFLTRAEHNRLHKGGKQLSEDTKERIRIGHLNMSDEKKQRIRDAVSKAHKGKTTWMKGKHHTNESKRKISEAAKNRKPRSQDILDSQSKKMSGKVFWNNGTICIRATERPDSTWSRGRLPYARTTNK